MPAISIVVSGEAVFDDSAPPFSGATAHIVLEETSQVDAAAVGIAHLEIPNVAYRPGREPLAFAFPNVWLDSTKRYEIRIHIDIDADGRVSSGDQITTESYPVPVTKDRAHLKLRLHRI